jgi:hypothetical protein
MYQGAGFIRARQSASLTGLAAWPSRGWREASRLGLNLFQMKPLGIFTTSSTNKLQTKFEDEDDDEYENDVGSTRTMSGRVRERPGSGLATQTRMV